MSKQNIPASTQSDDAGLDAGQEYQNFDDIPVPMGPMAAALGLTQESLPDEDESELDPDDSVDDDEPTDDTTDEDDTDDSDDIPDPDSDDDDEDVDDDDSTDDDSDSEDDIDWSFKVNVTIDGEDKEVTLEDLRKGYATDQHLSKKGRELGELEKSLKAEHQKTVQEVTELGNILSQQLTEEETKYAQEFHDLEAKIEKARDDGDTYDLSDLKDKRERAQKNYWKARNKREEVSKSLKAQQDKVLDDYIKEQTTKFNTEIKELVPDFDPKVTREFVLAEGIPEDFVNQIISAPVIKFIEDYRKLKMRTSSGAAKRKVSTKVKRVPANKQPSKKTKAAKQKIELRSKVLSGQGSEADDVAFLKGITKFR